MEKKKKSIIKLIIDELVILELDLKIIRTEELMKTIFWFEGHDMTNYFSVIYPITNSIMNIRDTRHESHRNKIAKYYRILHVDLKKDILENFNESQRSKKMKCFQCLCQTFINSAAQT